jgi:hypothetical protein
MRTFSRHEWGKTTAEIQGMDWRNGLAVETLAQAAIRYAVVTVANEAVHRSGRPSP